ncbi:MAG: glycosyltransferase [Spirosomataceae bacterium]
MTISVCLATYNGSEYITEQLKSILLQLRKHDEIIISDDNSTDNTVELIEQLNDSRIKIVYNCKKRGHVSNFENALNYSTGDYIFLSDQDDVWVSNKVEACLPYLEKYDCIISNYLVVDKYLTPLVIPEYKSNLADNKYLFLKSFIINRGWLGCCVCFNKKVKNLVLPFPKKVVAHDVWIVNCATLLCSVFYLDEKLVLQRRHGNNISVLGDNDMVITNKSNSDLLTIINQRLTILSYLIRLTNKKNIK